MVTKHKVTEATRENLARLIEQHKEVVRLKRLANPNFVQEFDEFALRTFDPQIVFASDIEADFDEEYEADELNGW